MNNYVITICVLITAAGIYSIITFNRFVRYRALIREAFSGIEVQLKKRYNLVPALVEVVKGYAHHENQTLLDLANARSVAMQAQGIAEREQAENMLGEKLGSYFFVVEDYPTLKADNNFKQLQRQLFDIEDDIEKSRRYFNATVRDNNIYVQSFPSMIIATLFRFHRHDFFVIDEPSHRRNPLVNLQP